jgi:hypothetical protein
LTQVSPLRAALLDTLRPAVEKEIGAPVIFVTHAVNVMDEWAFIDAEPKRSNGQSVDWRATKFRADIEADMFSGLVLALLQRQGSTWMVVELAIGPTDVAWVEWAQARNLPEALFKTP